MRFALPALCLLPVCVAAPLPDLSGKWQLTIKHFGRTAYASLTLKPENGGWTGDLFGDRITVTRTGSRIEIRCRHKDEDCGVLTGTLQEGRMSGSGTLFQENAAWTAQRAPALEHGSTRHEFVPQTFYNQFSSAIAPVLRIRPGDTVHTATVDAGGVDADGGHRAAGGNPLTGPFYIEGTWPGDILAVQFTRIRLNRDTAGIHANSVVLSALDPYYVRDQKPVENFDSTWKLDRAKGMAVLSKPTGPLKDFQVPLAPMLGCVGVAPPGDDALSSGRLGSYGGNMDYSRIREGTTVYLPVFHPGALLFVGDGHAAQGDGELTGNALETSMEVEFTVAVEEGGARQLRAEDSEAVMIMGIGNSLEDALREATTGMSRWLASRYKLNPAEIAMVLGSSMRYDIAEVVDPQVHIVARLSKSLLAKLPAQ